MKELFGDCHRGRRLKQSDRVEGTMPLATAGFENNGIASYINNPEMEVFENCLSIDMFGNCFYRDYQYNADDNILSFGKDGTSKECYKFIAAVINHDSKNFDFKFQYRQNNYEKHAIKLPATSDGNPDWNYMENYMKTIEAKAQKKLSGLLND
ncbi:MAG: restriction endonuclease subunit S [Synergistaceae bacterium]|nr:restriction endonuclease subunit S [Synergistaceae bacterium]